MALPHVAVTENKMKLDCAQRVHTSAKAYNLYHVILDSNPDFQVNLDSGFKLAIYVYVTFRNG